MLPKPQTPVPPVRQTPRLDLRLAAALVLVVGAGTWLDARYTFERHAQHAVGKVIRIEQSGSGRRHRYTPIVLFTEPVSGHFVRFRGPASRYEGAYLVDRPVTVLFDPQHPDSAEIDDGHRPTPIGWILLCLGIWIGADALAEKKRKPRLDRP